MQYCTACQKAMATVFVLDMREGAVVGQHNLCQGCAEQQGVVQAKTSTLKLPPELLEDLLGAAAKAPSEGRRKGTKEGPACPACGLSTTEFRSRGRLGCPRCYQTFRAALLPLLERLHDATTHRGRCLVRGAATAPAVTPAAPEVPAVDALNELRQRLAAAIRSEKYEEAASLRDLIKKGEAGQGGAAP